VFCLEHRRTVGHDWGVRFENQLLQLEPEQIAAGMTVNSMGWIVASLAWPVAC
jgi:hypothetical protein